MTAIEFKCDDEALKIVDELLEEYEEDYRLMASEDEGGID